MGLAIWLVACSGPDPKAGDPCTSIADCVADVALACSQSTCRRLSCTRSAGCPAGAACVAGVCAPPECSADEDCREFERCFEGDCRADLCEFKSQCERGEVCIGTPPQCRQPPARCEGDPDCPSDTYCQLPEQACARQCTSDTSCPADAYCAGSFCRLRCEVASDCAASDVCIDGRCEPMTCGALECPTGMGFVNPRSCECVQCLDDSDCSTQSGFGCSDEWRCLFCPLKSQDSTACAAQGLRLLEGCCAECIEDRDCSVGSSCSLGRCTLEDPRECIFDLDCPAGARCDLGLCVLPGSAMSCDRQADCPAGEACYGDGRCRAESTICEDCSAPGRCVAEPGDTIGSCVGCTTQCSPVGCGDRICQVPAGAQEGFCASSAAVACP